MGKSELNFDVNKIIDNDSHPVDKGNPQYLFNEYMRLYETRSFSKALECLSRSLHKGFPSAEYEMGQHYYLGNELLQISKDYAKAFHYFSIAALLDHSSAHYYQGLMYLRGEGVHLDIEQALSSLDTAAKKGVNEALHLLGKIYQSGYWGISADLKKAERYFCLAVNQDYPPSMLDLSVLLEAQHRFEEAYELIMKAAKLGYMGAISYNLSRYS